MQLLATYKIHIYTYVNNSKHMKYIIYRRHVSFRHATHPANKISEIVKCSLQK